MNTAERALTRELEAVSISVRILSELSRGNHLMPSDLHLDDVVGWLYQWENAMYEELYRAPEGQTK